MNKNKTETMIKIHPSSINEIYTIAIELNKQLIYAIIKEMQKQNSEINNKINEKIETIKNENEKLHTLKDISRILKIPYGTITHLNLPFHFIGKKTRRMYKLNEVTEYLKVKQGY